VAGIPLRPEVARWLHHIYLSKGIHGTTSIEGNTLTEEEVQQRIAGELRLPPSRAYLGVEVDNILAACNQIVDDLRGRRPMTLTPRRIADFNRQVLAGLDLDDDVVPGEVRTHGVVVQNYRGAPAEDCDFLLRRMCEWLDELDQVGTKVPTMALTIAILKAILAHLYIAWIHPFGDGNGRTARLIEFQLLIQAGVPLPAAHLLSDFYNKTRDAYYRALARTSKPPFPVEHFIHYALEGFVDEQREQLDVIRTEQMRVTWENFVHQSFVSDTPARHRQRCVVLDLGIRTTPIPQAKLPELSTRLAGLYAGKSSKTVTRDVNELLRKDLVRKVPGGIIANFDLIRAFLPLRAE
jgi:Fic family protein